MERLGELWRKLLFRVRRRQLDRELEDEIQFHLEMSAQESREAGIDGDEARYASQRRFGNVTSLRERSFEARGWPAIESTLKDLRIAVRSLIRNPAFSGVAILALVLGIGANTAVFSVIQGVLLRPLPFRDPDRVVMVWDKWRRDGHVQVSGAEFGAWRERARSVEGLAAIGGSGADIAMGDERVQVRSVSVSAGFFKALGVEPAAGRNFSAEEHRGKGARVVVLGHGLARRLGGNVVGKTVRLSRLRYEVVGVMPRGFAFPDESEVWFALGEETIAATGSNNHDFRVIARLKDTVARARTELETIAWPIQKEHAARTGTGVAVVPVREEVVGRARRALFALLGVVAFLLLIACANVASLSLSRATGRAREIAVRASLGASRGWIARYLLIESAVLALAGGALGLAGAYWAVQAFVASNPIELPRVQEIEIDAGVLLFTLAVALATALLIGLVPALRCSRPDLNSALKDAAGAQRAGTNRARAALAMTQIAIAIVMLAGAGVLLRSFIERVTVPLGFRPEGMLGVDLPWAAHRRLDELLDRVRNVPGVVSVGAATSFPHERAGTIGGFEIERQPQPPEQMPRAGKVVVTPDFFRAAGMRLLKGRFSGPSDSSEAPPVAVISDALARRHFSGTDPIGKRIRWGGPWLTVVGVVDDVNGFGADGPPLPAIYLPYRQADWDNGVGVLVRTAVPPASLAATLRKEIRAWNQNTLILRLAPIETMLSDSVAVPRFYMLLLAAFAAIAVAIAAIGVYGTLNYLVTQRTHEIGVRMTLGAGRGDVLSMVLGQGLTIVLAGLVFGLAGAWAATRVLSSLLFRVPPNDAVTFAGAAVLLVAIGLLACYLPARRATCIDPIRALRYE